MNIGRYALMLCLAFSSLQLHAEVIALCLESQHHQYDELLEDLLELQLLLKPSITTAPCTDSSPHTYRFLQRITALGEGNASDRWQIQSALYHNQRVLFSQLEFVDKPTRKNMNERALTLAASLETSLSLSLDLPDPFQEIARPLVSTTSTTTLATLPSLSSNNLLAKNKAHSSAFGFFVGMHQRSELHVDHSFFNSRDIAITKPFMLIGANLIKTLSPSWFMSITIKGALMPVELLRPVDNLDIYPPRILKMIELSGEMLWRYFDCKNISLSAGFITEGLAFSSISNQRVPEAKLAEFVQMKYGITNRATYFIDLLDSSLTLDAGLFPLVHNFSLGIRPPFVDFGYHLRLSAESSVYKTFGLKFSLEHQSEIFSSTSSRSRIVSQGNLAYLGALGKF